MAKGFNLTAEINLRGPANIRTVVADIRRQLGTVTANVDLRINPTTARNITTISQNLSRLNTVLAQTTTLSNQASLGLNNLARAGASASANIGNISRTTQAAAASVGQITNNANQAGNALQVARTEFEEFGRQSALAIRRFAALATVTSVIYKISNAITSATSEYLQFNKEIVRVAQVTDSSVESLSTLEKRITGLSTSFGVASKDLIQISSILAQAGLTAKDTEQALKALALSALAPSFDSLNETVEGSIALMRQFGIGASELEAALGSINAVSAKFAVESSDIITAIQRTGGVFAAASRGVSSGKDALNEFIAVFTSVRATTRESAETIATGLRTIFTRIQRGGTIDALKEYGVILTDLEGKFVGPYEAVRRLALGLNQLDPRDLRFGRIVEELGGFRQIGKVIPLIQQFATAQQALVVAQRGQGSLATDAATAQQALAVRISKVREEFIALIRSVGQSDSFQQFVKLSLDLASGLIRVADAAKDVLPALTAIAAIRGASFLTQFGTGFIGGLRKRNSNGGQITKFASGGLVPGSGNEDNFPALLQPGEFVMKKTAVDSIGRNNLRSMNSGGSLKKISKFMAGGASELEINTAKPGKVTQSGGVFLHLVKSPSIGGSSNLVKTLQPGAAKGAPIVGLSNLGIMLHGAGPGLNQDLAKKIAKFPKQKFIDLISKEDPRRLFGRQLQLSGMSRSSGAGSFREGKKSTAYKTLDDDQILRRLQQILVSASSQYLPDVITQDSDLYPLGKALYQGTLDINKDLASGFAQVRELKYNLDTSKNQETGEYNNARYANRVRRTQITGRRLTSEVQPRFSKKFQKEQREGLLSFESDDGISYHSVGGPIGKFMAGGKAKEERPFGTGEFKFPKRVSNAYFREQDNDALKAKAEELGLYGRFHEFPEEKRVPIDSAKARETFEARPLDRTAFAESFKKKVSKLALYQNMSDFAKFIGLPREDLSLVLPETVEFTKKLGSRAFGEFDRTGIGKKAIEEYDTSIFGPAQEQDLYGYSKLLEEKQKEIKKIQKTPTRTFDDGSFSIDSEVFRKTWDEADDIKMKISAIKSKRISAQSAALDQIQQKAAATGRGTVTISTGFLPVKNDTLYHELTHQLFQSLRTRSAESFTKYRERVVALFSGDNDDLANAFDALENSYNSADVVYGRSYKVGALDSVIQQNRSVSGGSKPAKTPEAAMAANTLWAKSLGIKKAKEFQPINPDVNQALLDNSISQSYIDRIEDSGKEEFLTTLIQNANKLDPLLQSALDSTLTDLLGSAGIARQQYVEGGKVERKIGIVDTDVLRNPANAAIVGPAMERLGITDTSKYSVELGRLAAQARKSKSLSRLTAIAGAAGAGKSSLATGRGANDDATLRKTIRSQILTPEDIAKVNEVIVLTSSAGDNKLDAYLRDVDRAYVLSSSTEAEKEKILSNRAQRDLTGEGLYGRKPGATAGAGKDFTLEETILRDELGSKAMVLGRKGEGYGLRRKRENELPEIVQAEGFYTGGFSPPTKGHRGAFDALLNNVIARNPNATASDILVSVAPNLAMSGGEGKTEAEKIAHAARYGIFPADMRLLLSGINFPGAMITGQEGGPAGSLPKFMEVETTGDRRKFARLKGALAITSGKDEQTLGKYGRAGIQVTDIPRIDDISATKVRDALFHGNDASLSSFLDPQIASVLMGNRAQLRNRSMMVPMLIEEIKKYAEGEKARVKEQELALLATVPGGPYKVISQKVRETAPDVAEKIEEMREQRDRTIKGLLGYRAHNIISLLSSKYPEAYALDSSRRAMVSVPPKDLSKEAIMSQISEGMAGEFSETQPAALPTAIQQAILAKVTKETAGPKGSGEMPTTTQEILSKLGDSVLPSDPQFGDFAGKRIRDTATKQGRLGWWATKYADTLAMNPKKLAAFEATREYVKNLYSEQSSEDTGKALAETTEQIQKSTMLGLVGLYGKNGITGPVVWNLGKNTQGEEVDLNATIMERVLPAKYKSVTDYISSQTDTTVANAAQMLGKKDPKKLTEKQKGVLNQGNIEGGILEQLLAVLGGDVLDDAVRTRAIDFPSGIGAFAAKIFGIPANIPTEAKRTIDSTSRNKAIEEFQRHFKSVYGIPESEEEKIEAKVAQGGLLKYAQGGVTALVSNGEAFVPPSLAKKIGYSTLDRMNQADKNGMAGFASGSMGGISIFNGPGTGTSDSIGPIQLPIGGYVLRERATKALGLKSGGGIGNIQRFVKGGTTVAIEDMALEQQAKKIAVQLIKGGTSLGDALDQARKQVMDSVQGPSMPTEKAIPQPSTITSGRDKGKITYQGGVWEDKGTQDIQQERLQRRAAKKGADITKVGIQGSQEAFDAKAANRNIGYSFEYDTLGGKIQGSVRGTNISSPQNTPYQIGRTASSSSTMSQAHLNQILNSMTNSAQKSAGFFKQIQTAASSVATKTTSMFGNLKNYAMGTHTLSGKKLDDDVIQRRIGRGQRAQQMGMALAFTAPMIGEMAGSAIGGTTGAGISSATTGFSAAMGVGMQFAGIPFVGTIAMFTGALAGAVSAVDSYNKGVAEAEKQLSEKRIQSETENVDRSLKSLEKDPRNIAASKAVVSSIEKIASEENKVMQQNKIINEPGMVAKALNYASFGYIGTGEKTTEEIAQQNTTANKAASDVAMQALTSKISGGMTMEEALKSFGNPDMVKQQIAEGVGGEFAIKNARLQKSREKFVGKTDSTSQQILGDLDAAIKENNEAAFKSATELLRASEADMQRAKAAKAVAKALNQASVSIDRTFSNMESALSRGADVLSKTSESLSSLASGAVSTRGVFAQQNVLENPGAYTEKERQQAVSSASAVFGQDAGFIQRLTSVGSRVKDTIASLTVNAQQTGGSKELAAENIQRAVDKQLRDAFGDNNLSRQISEQLRVALGTQVADEKTKEIDLDKLLSETSGLTSLLESEKKAFKALSDAAKLATDSISLYSEQLDKATAMMNEARSIRAESVGARASNEFRMIEAFGGKVGIQDRLNARREETATRLGIKPSDANLSSLQQRLNSLTQQRSQVENQKTQFQANNAITDPKTIQGVNNFNKTLASLNNEIQSTKDAIKGLPKDIQGMLDDTFGELQKRIGELEAVQQASASFAEKMVTSTPTELTDLNNTYGMLTNALNGQVRTIQQSVAAQQAYNQTINNGGTMVEAMSAAQTAFAAENRNVFSMFNEMLSIAGPNIDKQEGNRMRADLLENMARSQGMNVQNSPFFAQLIASLRKAPAEDPEIKKLKDLYTELSASQQEAFTKSSEAIMKDASNLITQAAQEIKKAIETSRISFNMQQLQGVGLGISRPGQVMQTEPARRSDGGIVYASSGKFIPRGTDTVPAMLSPGEFVVNAQSTKANLPVLDAINKSKGGVISYLRVGTIDPVGVSASTGSRRKVSSGNVIRTELVRRGMDPNLVNQMTDSQLMQLREDFLMIPAGGKRSSREAALQRWISRQNRAATAAETRALDPLTRERIDIARAARKSGSSYIDTMIARFLSKTAGDVSSDPSLRTTMSENMRPFNAFGNGPKPAWMNTGPKLSWKLIGSDIYKLMSSGVSSGVSGARSLVKGIGKYGSGVMSRVDDTIPGLGQIPWVGQVFRGAGAATTVGKDVTSPVFNVLRTMFNMASGQSWQGIKPSGIERGIANLGLGVLSNAAIGTVLPALGFSETTTQNTQGVSGLGLGAATALRAGSSLQGATGGAIALNTGISILDELTRYGYSAATGTTDEYWKYREQQDSGVHNPLESGITAGLNPARLFSRYFGFHMHNPLAYDPSYSAVPEKFDAPGTPSTKPVNKPMGRSGTSLDNAIAQAELDFMSAEHMNRPRSFGMAARTFRYGVPVKGTPDLTQDGTRTVRLTKIEEDWVKRQANLLDQRSEILKIKDEKVKQQQLAIIDRDIKNHEDARTAMTESSERTGSSSGHYSHRWVGRSIVRVPNLPNIGSRDRADDKYIADRYVAEYREGRKKERLEAANSAQQTRKEAEDKKKEQQDEEFSRGVQSVFNFASSVYSGASELYNQTVNQEKEKEERSRRSRTNQDAMSILEKPALPSLINDESLSERKRARDQTLAELNSIEPPRHPFDVAFDERGGGIGNGQKTVDFYVTDSLSGERVKRSLTRQQYEAQFPERMRDHELNQEDYAMRRKAAQDKLDAENRSIVDWNEKAAVGVSPAERAKQWADYNIATQTEKEKLRKKTEIDQKRASKRAENEALKQEAGMFSAVAQTLRMPMPNSPLAVGNFRDRVINRLKSSFGAYGANDPKTLRSYGMNEDAIKFLFNPFNEDQNKALSEIITKRLYEGASPRSSGIKRDYGLLKAAYEGPDGVLEYVRKTGNYEVLDRKQFLDKLKYKEYGQIMANSKRFNDLAYNARISGSPTKQAGIRNNISKRLSQLGYINPRGKPEDNARRLNALGFAPDTVSFIYPGQVGGAMAGRMSRGGVVYASEGTYVNYEPRGTDTVPAMLTPGEFVVNARATAQHLPLLQAINQSKGGDVKHLSKGGVVYAQQGGCSNCGQSNCSCQKFAKGGQAKPLNAKQQAYQNMMEARRDAYRNNKQKNLPEQNNNQENQQKITYDLRDIQQQQQAANSAYIDLLPYTSGPLGAARFSMLFRQGLQNTSLNFGGSRANVTVSPDGRNVMTMPTPIVTKSLVDHELGHIISIAANNTGMAMNLMPWIKNYAEYMNTTGFKDDHLPIGAGGNGYYTSQDLLNKPQEVFPSILGLKSQDPQGFSATGGDEALRMAMANMGFSSGGIVYAQYGSYIPFKTPKDKALNDRRLEVERIQEEKRRSLILSTLRKQLDATLAPAVKADQYGLEMRTRRDNYEDAIQDRRNSIPNPEEIKFAVDLEKEQRKYQAEQVKENARLEAAAAKAKRFNTVKLPPINKAFGGVVYANDGMMVPYEPRGTDTVPAMLTPGEFVINRESTAKHLPLLKSINSGSFSNGGMVSYLQDGGTVNSRRQAYSDEMKRRKEAYEEEMARRRQRYQQEKDMKSMAAFSDLNNRGLSIPSQLQKRVDATQNRDPLTYNIMRGKTQLSQQAQSGTNELNTNFSQINQQSQLINRSFIQLGGSVIALTQILGKLNGEISLIGGGAGVSNTSGKAQLGLDGLSQFVTKFDTFIESLSKLNLPPIISLQVAPITLNITGGESLRAALEGPMRDQIRLEIASAFSRLNNATEGAIQV